MRKFLVTGALALAAAAISQQPAFAWKSASFGVGLNFSYSSGGNSCLWGMFRNGQPGQPDFCGKCCNQGNCCPPIVYGHDPHLPPVPAAAIPTPPPAPAVTVPYLPPTPPPVPPVPAPGHSRGYYPGYQQVNYAVPGVYWYYR